ncbi:SPOR domain-containing protein [Erythrobacter sp. T5W1-R]|uniref:SPOR domain-containing protein n=1 Tax=Erythrobacter sp. T5W1-R TaxID=3101752 RepID=UPI002AFE153B|nr:SPOR domain-containing protein [Erythrobacter sp. T5W1-R]MEA1617472.1 SPOR domain-containing protein [Erythrobacter sp. T5W1-R]
MSPKAFPFARSFRRALGSGVLASACAMLANPVQAQEVTSREVVQPLPSGEVQRLNRALVQLARDPRDLPALLEAGEASLAVDDFEAANGFFARALVVEQTNQRAALGLARVALRSGDALGALERFEKAVRAGAPEATLLTDRGLAFDMTGDQAAAQAAYRRALEVDPRDNEARRRLALSFAIAGNRGGFEDTLRPLLDERDIAALRTRAFGLAIFGEQERAAAIVDQVMPRDLSSRLVPYLAFMPRLTKPQQAAAANLGIFPRAADIGRDDPRLARFAREGQSDSRLQPSGKPLGVGPARVSARAGSEPSPSQPGVVPSSVRSARRVAAAEPRVTVVPNPPTPAPAPAPAPAQVAQPAPSAPAPLPASPPPPAPLARVADAFADLGGALPQSGPSGGGVDITRIQPPREVAARPEPKPEAKPKEPAKPAHPARNWVQIATGRQLAALKFDWRRFERKGGDLFKGMQPHTTRWGEANRLLVGPLTSPEKARDLVKRLKEKGVDSFFYASPEGEEIQVLK